MTTANLFRLLILSAIWGGSFLLIRIGAPALGGRTLAGLVLGIAGTALVTGFSPHMLALRKQAANV